MDAEIQKELDNIKESINNLSKKLDKVTQKKENNFYADILDSIDSCQKYIDHYNKIKKFRDRSNDLNLTNYLDKLINELNNPKALNSNLKIDLEKTSYQTVRQLREYCQLKINEIREI